jgi:glutamine amidotransferase
VQADPPATGQEILDEQQQHWEDSFARKPEIFGAQPSAPALPIIEKWAVEVACFGVFNFLLSDTRYPYAHRSTYLFYASRACASQTEWLKNEEMTVRLAQGSNGSQRVAAVATEPLTADEEWKALPEARVATFPAGRKNLLSWFRAASTGLG